MTAVYQSIRDYLDKLAITYRAVEHQPTFTSEESAKARGEDVRVGGKALLIKTGDVFRLFVLSAALKLDTEALKRRFAVKKTRFATADELKELTGLVPGSVPPFGKPILPFDLFIDESITRNERIAFNAGSLTQSLILSVPDYLKAAQGEVFSFSTVG
ncbi:MAG TPA: YbaK/EbsC family protein [Phycisphaerae bacterium]|nr:YbaK/EbsC family protein [Phycisphaerae bacterium]